MVAFLRVLFCDENRSDWVVFGTRGLLFFMCDSRCQARHLLVPKQPRSGISPRTHSVPDFLSIKTMYSRCDLICLAVRLGLEERFPVVANKGR